MFAGSEVISAVEGCPLGVCRKNYTITISSVPTIYRNEAGEVLYRAQGRIGGAPLEGVHLVPESIKMNPYSERNLDWLKAKIFSNSRISSDDVQVGCATPTC